MDVEIAVRTLQCLAVTRLDSADNGYNGSLSPHGDGYIFFYRTGGILYGSKRLIKLGFLDSKLEPITEMKPLCEGGHGDPRVTATNDGYLLVTSDDSRVFEWRFGAGDGNLSYSGPVQLDIRDFDMFPVERNWTPFIHENETYYIYTINPFTVIGCKDGECRVVSRRETGIDWKLGVPAGGTPAVPWSDDEYITFFHSFVSPYRNHYHIPRYYFTGALCFSRTFPFDLTRYTPSPVEYDNLPSVSNPKCPHRVLFPAGLVVEDGQVILSLGVNDISNCIVQIDRGEVERALAPI